MEIKKNIRLSVLYILIFVFLINSSYAIVNYTTDLHTQSLVFSGSTIPALGAEVYIKNNVRLNRVGLHSSVGATNCYVRNSTCDLIDSTTTITNNECIFNNTGLAANTTYYITVDKLGASYPVARDTSPSYPYNGVNLNFISFVDGTCAGNTGTAYNILNITTSIETILPIETNITGPYNTENISVQVNATQETSIAYHLDDDDLIVSDGLVAYYQAENNANDRTGTNNGTLNGGTNFTDSVNSSYMNAFEFDGVDDYVSVQDSSSLDIQEDITLCQWVKPSTLTFNANPYLVSKDTLTYYSFWRPSSADFRFQYFNTTGQTQVIDSNPLSLSIKWYNICFTKDDSIGKVFINGVLDNTVVLNGDISTSTSDLYIGSRRPSSNFWNGSIDEVRIYNKALSTTEIELLYNTSPYKTVYDNPLSNGLIAYYQAEDNTRDRQGLNDGTPNGGLTYTSSANSSFGEAFDFDGVDDTLLISDNEKLRLINGGTISAWIYPNTIGEGGTGGSGAGRIVDKSTNTDGGSGYSFRVGGTNQLRFQIDNSIFVTSGNNDILLNQWNYVTVSFNDTDKILYVNGVDVTSSGGSSIGLPPDVPGTVSIGNRPSATDRTFDGSIDEVRIYNRALNSTEVTELYQQSPNYGISADFNLTNVPEGNNNITFFTQFASLHQSFYVDTTNPTIINSIGNRTILYYNFTNQFNSTNTYCIDDNLDTCYINITGVATDLNNTEINLYSLLNGNITYIQNYTFGGYNSTGNYTIIPLFDLGYGTYNFTFTRDGYEELNRTVEFNETTNLNITYLTAPAYINIYVRELSNGSLVSPDNFTLLYSDNIGTSVTYDIINNNTISILNFYDSSATITLNLVDTNGTILTNRVIVAPRKNTSISFYIAQGETLYTKSFEVLTSGLVAITNSFVYLYANLKDTDEFVLLQQKQTNEIGVVNFDVVPGQYAYTICNTNNGAQKCLNQVIFDTIVTDYQIVHDSTLESTTRDILDFISWSYDEVKTNTSSQISFYYEDRQNNVDAFCLNISRFNNDIETNLGGTCSETLSGVIVQTYGLTENQYLQYTFSYKVDDAYFPLNQYTSRFDGQAETDLRDTGLLDLVFLIVVFGSAGLLLGFKRFEVYVPAFLGILLLLSILQVFFNESYIEITLWGVLATKWAFFYLVRGD